MDLLKGMKYSPNITILDIAHLLAAHRNKTNSGFFNPHDGRLAGTTEENIMAANTPPQFVINCLDEQNGSSSPDSHRSLVLLNSSICSIGSMREIQKKHGGSEKNLAPFWICWENKHPESRAALQQNETGYIFP
jgi:hypothetical protein